MVEAANPGMPADGELIERLVADDQEALAAIYDRHGQTAFAVAYAIVGERGGAEDVVANTFLQVWQQAQRYRRGRGSVAAWIYTIARSRALDHWRAGRRRVRGETQAAEWVPEFWEGSWSPPGPEEQTVHVQRRQAVTAALAELPVAQRRVIEMAYYRGLSQSEIAAELDEPLGTVKTRIRSGMQKLQTSLAGQRGYQ